MTNRREKKTMKKTKTVEPKVYLVAKTAPTGEHWQWLDDMGASDFEIPSETPPGTALTTLAGKRCYKSFSPELNKNLTRVRGDLSAFIENILSTGHGSVLEHVSYTFAIENVSRILTAEFNRHRAGMAVSEGSMRFIRYDDMMYWIPPSIHDKPTDSDELRDRKQQSRVIFERAFSQAEQNYQDLCQLWGINEADSFKEKKELTSLFRRVIPMGVATGGVWTGNLRALRHIFTMRCDPAAEEEICYVASMMLERMVEAEPDVFRDFEKVDGYWKPKHRKV